MTIDKEDQLDGLKQVGGIVARTLEAMRAAAEHGMTTAELDAIGAACLEREGARSPPQVTYNFPGAACISIFPAIAHGIPNKQVLTPGQLINVDVSAEKNATSPTPAPASCFRVMTAASKPCAAMASAPSGPASAR
jgi:methionyl aminopeptidase